MTVQISPAKLRELYLNKKLSTCEIGKRYQCDSKTIWKKLKKYKIPMRTKSEAQTRHNISRRELQRFYSTKKLSTFQIAAKYDCGASTILSKLKKYHIRTRSAADGAILSVARRAPKIAQAMTKYPRKDFCGTLVDKAYLIGFRLGDLHVRKNQYGQTIYVQTWSTKQEQINLIKSLFALYGHLAVHNRSDGCMAITCYLNVSFSFLLNDLDEIPLSILENRSQFFSFLAGYIRCRGLLWSLQSKRRIFCSHVSAKNYASDGEWLAII